MLQFRLCSSNSGSKYVVIYQAQKQLVDYPSLRKSFDVQIIEKSTFLEYIHHIQP